MHAATYAPAVIAGQGPAAADGPQHALSPLVTPPGLDRRLPARRRDNPAAWWLLGAHGGAGVSSLRRAGVPGFDAEACWPLDGLVVVVVRRTASGLEWARDAARQHASGNAPAGVVLAGLVVVADAPGRTPGRVASFLDLVCGAYPRVWEVPWVEEWRLAGHAESLPLPPAGQQLNRDMQALSRACPTSEKE